jgi:aspartate kinase
MEKTIVLKFGGASLKDLAHFENVAKIIEREKQGYDRVCVVVSAIDGLTDYLLDLAKLFNKDPPAREKDMLLSVGERVSMALLAMVLQKYGIQGESLTGSQAGIITTNEHSNAKIIDVVKKRLESLFAKGAIPVIAGFQGVSLEGEITTLGRGGSDTTAVALAVALKAEKVVFYKDVKGVYSKDPKQYRDFEFFETLSYKKALEVVGKAGSALLHPRAIALAEKNHLLMQVRSFDEQLKDHSGSKVFLEDQENKEQKMFFEESLV